MTFSFRKTRNPVVSVKAQSLVLGWDLIVQVLWRFDKGQPDANGSQRTLRGSGGRNSRLRPGAVVLGRSLQRGRGFREGPAVAVGVTRGQLLVGRARGSDAYGHTASVEPPPG